MKSNYNILIVEDELIASLYLSQILNSLGHNNVYISTNAKDALDILSNTLIDFAFVDINIQGSIDGIKCSHLLNEKYSLPIIFTTAYNDSQIMKEASKTNMYGYLIKPFEVKDVEASIYTIESRLQTQKYYKEEQEDNTKSEYIDLGNGYSFHIDSKTLLREDIPLNLTKKEIEVLYVLCMNINQNVSYDLLQEQVWSNKYITDSTIRDAIRRLRSKSENLNIQSISGMGYILRKA